MRISEILDPKRIVLDLEPGSKREILSQLAGKIRLTHSHLDIDQLVDVLVKREETSTTAIADGIAIPHGKLEIGEEVICGFGRSANGVDFESVDGCPTQLFFLLVSPESHPSLHLRWLAHLAVLLKNAEFRESLLAAKSEKEIMSVIEKEETAHAERSAPEES